MGGRWMRGGEERIEECCCHFCSVFAPLLEGAAFCLVIFKYVLQRLGDFRSSPCFLSFFTCCVRYMKRDFETVWMGKNMQ